MGAYYSMSYHFDYEREAGRDGDYIQTSPPVALICIQHSNVKICTNLSPPIKPDLHATFQGQKMPL